MSYTVPKYGIPNLDDIKKQYNDLIPLMESLNTKQDVIDFEDKYDVTMEINYESVDEFDEKNEPIDVIRCESWKDLTYIYVYKNDIKPTFDVWSEFYDSEFIENITIDELDTTYKNGLLHLWNISAGSPYDQESIILALHDQGMSIKDILIINNGKHEMLI